MAWTTIPGGWWVPWRAPNVSNAFGAYSGSTAATVDADEEELQFIGRVAFADGPGTSATFGTAGSSITWRAGAVTFANDGASDPTFRIGVKKAASIDLANGPDARATIGAAAFDVYKDLVGGTDTIGFNSQNTTAMASGVGFTVTHGDLIAICFHLDKPGAAAQTIGILGHSNSASIFPAVTLVTSGPTYTAQNIHPNAVLTFDNGAIGWLEGSQNNVALAVNQAIGNGDIYGNIMRFPFGVRLSGISAELDFNGSGAANCDIGIWTNPLGTPSPASGGVISFDANARQLRTGGTVSLPFTSLVEVAASTDILAGVKQTTANAVDIAYFEVLNTAHWPAGGMGFGPEVYAAESVGGAAAAAINSSKQRAAVFVKIHAIDIPAGGSGGGPLVGGRLVR